MAEDVAARANLAFAGLWLEVPQPVLEARLRARQDGPSDADIGVPRQQLAAGCGEMTWARLDASGDARSVLAAAMDALAPKA